MDGRGLTAPPTVPGGPDVGDLELKRLLLLGVLADYPLAGGGPALGPPAAQVHSEDIVCIFSEHNNLFNDGAGADTFIFISTNLKSVHPPCRIILANRILGKVILALIVASIL